ncbi:hypothetical protein JCM6882_005070 [Rhodosporidiobolus microsporus]
MDDYAWPARNVVKVAVLLDGDNDMFAPAYLANGFRGGRTAALDLRSKVHAAVIARERELSGASGSFRPPEVHIMAKVFLDMSGESSRLQGVDLPAFVQGFTTNGVVAGSISDVGSARQAADEAIKGHLPFFLSACDLVLLGSTRDGGYATDLLRLDLTVLQEKVVLVRTARCAERILELGMQELQLPGLFEGQAVVDGPKPAQPAPPPQPFPFTFSASSATPISQIFGSPSPALSRTPSLPPPSSSPLKSVSPVPPLGLPSMASPSPAAQQPPASAPPSTAPAPPPPPPSLAHALAAVPLSPSPPAPRSAPSAPPSTAPAPSSTAASASPTSPQRRPPASQNGTADPSARFQPLLAILRLFHDQQGQPRPRRADVGQRLKQRFPEFKNRSFGEYAREAEKAGVVVLGKGGKLGSEWIARKGWEEEEAHGEKGEKDDLARMMGGLSLAAGSPSKKAASASAPPAAAPAAPPPPPPPPPPPHPYLSLLTLLLSQLASFKPRPLRSFVGDHLRKVNIELGPGKRLFDQASKEGLREYLAGAEKEGWVRFGRGEGVGAEWVELVDPEKTKAYLAAPPPQPTPAAAPAPPPSAPAAAAPAPSARPIPPHILPLLRAIETCKFPVPHWTSIGATLNRLRPKPYEEGGFKAYVLAAERDGWIATGKIEDKEGMYWMRLSEVATASLAALPPPSSSAASSTSASPARHASSNNTATAASTPFTGPLPAKFHPLVAAIRAQPIDAPHWTNVGGVLNRVRPRVYDEGGFKAYVLEAAKKGIIRVGRVEDKENMFWMRLTRGMEGVEVEELDVGASVGANGHSQGAESKTARPQPHRNGSTSSSATAAYEVDSSTIPAADHIPPRFLPLLRAIVSSDFPRPFYSQIGYTMNRMEPRPYGDHAESATMREYVEEAVLLGLVERGKGAKTGQDWIAVKNGLDLPAELQAARTEATTSRSAQAAAPAPPVTSTSLFPPLPGNAPPTARVSSVQPQTPRAAFTPSPVISTTPAFSPFPSSTPGPVLVPADVLARWRPLAAFDPFAPLVIALQYLSQTHRDAAPSLSKLRSVLEQFPAEVLPGSTGGAPLERVIKAGGAAEAEGLFGYLAKAQREGVVEIVAGGVALKEQWRDLEGLS